MIFRELEYMTWAKTMPPADVNMARSGIEHCPPSLLGVRARDLVVNLPVRWGYRPLVEAIAARYRVAPGRVFTVSGGTSLADWLACAAALDGAPRGAEVIVERPTYEPLLRIPQSFGVRIRRLPRRFREAWAIDLDRFSSLVTPKTRLAIVSNLHNPTGVRIPPSTLRAMAERLARVGGYLLVDEVYLECLFDRTTQSSVHAGPNVITASSLTKAYGLDGLRAGWLLGPAALIRKAALIHDILGNNGVAPGEQLELAAFHRLAAISRRSHALLDPNLERVRAFFAREPRLSAVLPPGGNVVFPVLPRGLDGDRFADHLLRRHSTLIVPGRFFEAPRHVRFSFGMRPQLLARGLRNLSLALDELGGKK
jgi:aspartate/methionine/tyrosine aminotransferase